MDLHYSPVLIELVQIDLRNVSVIYTFCEQKTFNVDSLIR